MKQEQPLDFNDGSFEKSKRRRRKEFERREKDKFNKKNRVNRYSEPEDEENY